jgi:pyridoxamine 5'-phosphate oxidase
VEYSRQMDSLNRHEDYGQEALDETHLLSDPFAQFKEWLVDAEQADIYEPNAFVLGTATTDGQPRSRTVLLKGVDSQGFFFATNFESRKGRAIAANSKVSATFGWYSMYRQVLVEGVAVQVPSEDSDEYFASRPHDSQVAAWSSHQSQPIKNRSALDQQFDEALDKFKNSDVPRPAYWGGYRIVPTRIEFWKGRSNRMHDRIEFVRTLDSEGAAGEWQIQRLQP